jgi:hypothetical protein
VQDADSGLPRRADGTRVKIDFLVAGVQKCGTTSLHRVLRNHPSIGMSRPKELHFFNDDQRNWMRPNYRELHRHFESGRQIYGEATPITLYWTRSHTRIRAYNPEIRFILLFRDPIERAYSHWCMQFARQRESSPFGEAIRNELRQPRCALSYRDYVARGLYAAQLGTLRETFRKARILYLLSEEFRENPAATRAKVAEFLDVDPDGFDPTEFTAMRRPRISYPVGITEADCEWLRGVYWRDLARFATITGLDIERWKAVTR